MRITIFATAACAGLLMAAPASATPRETVDQVLDLINAQRAEHGCAPLKLEPRLEAAAERESRDMATRHFFNHTEPDGTTPGVRVHDTGYVFQMVGENIEVNTDAPEDAVMTWMKSPGHRANILLCAFKETGIAVVEQADDQPVEGVPVEYKAYWTQVFALPLPGY